MSSLHGLRFTLEVDGHMPGTLTIFPDLVDTVLLENSGADYMAGKGNQGRLNKVFIAINIYQKIRYSGQR